MIVSVQREHLAITDSVIEPAEISVEEPRAESAALANSIDDLIAKIKMKYEITDTTMKESNVVYNNQSDYQPN